MGKMAEIQGLLRQGKTPKEIIEEGYRKSTVYVAYKSYRIRHRASSGDVRKLERKLESLIDFLSSFIEEWEGWEFKTDAQLEMLTKEEDLSPGEVRQRYREAEREAKKRCKEIQKQLERVRLA
jgi:hypothetical protein